MQNQNSGYTKIELENIVRTFKDKYWKDVENKKDRFLLESSFIFGIFWFGSSTITSFFKQTNEEDKLLYSLAVAFGAVGLNAAFEAMKQYFNCRYYINKNTETLFSSGRIYSDKPAKDPEEPQYINPYYGNSDGPTFH